MAGEVTVSPLRLGHVPWRPCEPSRRAQAGHQAGERASPDPGDSRPGPSAAVGRQDCSASRSGGGPEDSVTGELHRAVPGPAHPPWTKREVAAEVEVWYAVLHVPLLHRIRGGSASRSRGPGGSTRE